MSEEAPRLSAVVLAWKAEPWLRRGVDGLLASEKVAVDVVLVDNGCTTDDVEVLERLPGVTPPRWPGSSTRPPGPTSASPGPASAWPTIPA